MGSEQLGGTVNVFKNPQTSGQGAKSSTVVDDREGAGDTASESLNYSKPLWAKQHARVLCGFRETKQDPSE